MQIRKGRCLCGDVRYVVTGEPVTTRICWCRDCQRLAGNGTVNAIFPTASIQITGNLSDYTSAAESGNQVRRRFCASCGSHLFAENTGRVGSTVVRVGTLDDPSSISPALNIWSSSAPTWACLSPAMQDVAKQPQAIQPPPGAA